MYLKLLNPCTGVSALLCAFFPLVNITIFFSSHAKEPLPSGAYQQRKISVNVSAVVKSANMIQYIIHLTWQTKTVSNYLLQAQVHRITLTGKKILTPSPSLLCI